MLRGVRLQRQVTSLVSRPFGFARNGSAGSARIPRTLRGRRSRSTRLRCRCIGVVSTKATVVAASDRRCRRAALASRVVPGEVTVTEIEDVLLARADYIDEEKWCRTSQP